MALVRGTDAAINAQRRQGGTGACNAAGNGAGDIAAAFDAALTAVREAHAGETAAMRDRIEVMQVALDRAEAGRDAERVRADALADEARVMQAKLATAEVVVDQARRDAQATQDRADAERQRRDG